MHYPLVNQSGRGGYHFTQGYHEYLERVLGVKVPLTDLCPAIYLDQNEKLWPSPAVSKLGVTEKYWVINAGAKANAFPLKQYHRYQEVVDLLGDITLVQIGHLDHDHKPLTGVKDMRGKTTMRELFRLIYHAQGVITCVSFPMHIAAAFNKPCVVVAGAREGTRWELYPNHQFIYRNGCLPCASYDGCWRSKNEQCDYRRDGVPVCMTLIKPEEIARCVNLYYEGGMLLREEMAVAR
jgi:ADP-heptose:LPS heptosyltransferase